MSEELTQKILLIFKTELNKDLNDLENFIESRNHQNIFDWTHKYKLRFHYLNLKEVQAVNQEALYAFKNDEFDKQIVLAKKLVKYLNNLDMN